MGKENKLATKKIIRYSIKGKPCRAAVIKVHVFDRETTGFYWVDERRVQKHSLFFETFEAAKTALLESLAAHLTELDDVREVVHRALRDATSLQKEHCQLDNASVKLSPAFWEKLVQQIKDSD